MKTVTNMNKSLAGMTLLVIVAFAACSVQTAQASPARRQLMHHDNDNDASDGLVLSAFARADEVGATLDPVELVEMDVTTSSGLGRGDEEEEEEEGDYQSMLESFMFGAPTDGTDNQHPPDDDPNDDDDFDWDTFDDDGSDDDWL